MATRLTNANAELQAVVRGQLEELSASRRRLVSAADDERRRLDERLRDGAERSLLDLDELLVLNALWQERSLDTAGAGLLIQKPVPETLAILHRLVEAGVIEEHGRKKGRTWHLSAATYRSLGAKAAYVRQRGFEPLQQAQMVLQYVQKHGRITRREAAELCRISGDQAYRLLNRLAGEGRLVREGSRGRGVSYHGIALNVTVDLSDFDLIDACGMPGVVSTSIAAERASGEPPSTASVEAAARVFATSLATRLGIDGAIALPDHVPDPTVAIAALERTLAAAGR